MVLSATHKENERMLVLNREDIGVSQERGKGEYTMSKTVGVIVGGVVKGRQRRSGGDNGRDQP
jgi:hypothetical protein